jgi:hypothetical protein
MKRIGVIDWGISGEFEIFPYLSCSIEFFMLICPFKSIYYQITSAIYNIETACITIND